MANAMRWVCVLGLWLPGIAAARHCEIDGEEVNPDNGSTTAGKTGMLVCRHDDGSLMYEHELRDGQHIGFERSRGFDGGVSERQVNANGNSDGPAREFYPDGKLKSEGTYSDGDAVGLGKSYHKNGKVSALRFHEKAGKRAVVTLEYNDAGRLREFSCGAKSYLPEDREPCGFGGKPVEVALHGRGGAVVEKRTMRDGKLVRTEGFDDAGKLRESVETTAGGRITRKFHDNGQVASEAVVENDWVVAETEWYMNGSVREKTATTPDERQPRVVHEYFRDTGMLREREELLGRDRVRSERFDEKGARSEEFVYGDDGNVRLHRKFAPDGRITLEEELYPDGSRKVISGEPEVAQ
jgi:antitoxin component YwqK of YwqJK toxin-antitoxin module